MASKKSTSAMDFVVAALKKNPKVSYAAVKEAAAKKKYTIYPIMYGRAKALLGLVPVAKRGSKKKKAARKTAARRGPGRPRKERSPLDSLSQMVAEMKTVESERESYRKALQKIQDILDSVL